MPVGFSGPMQTVSLIGMPGAGKSSVGVLLAKLLGLGFLDTDLEIQLRESATLQTILEQKGYRYLRAVEESVLLAVDIAQRVVSTGGSAVYSERGMQRLLAAGPVVYLCTDLDTLEKRVSVAPNRGIASDPNAPFAQVFSERTPLYERYGQHRFDTGQGSAQDIAVAIANALRE